MSAILGIDPGLQVTGYALMRPGAAGVLADPRLIEAGVIRLQSSWSIGQRLVELERELAELMEGHEPEVCAVEKLYAHYQHPRTAILMGHARGVILLKAAQRGLEVIDVPATEVKKAVTGYGHASKEQIQRAVMGQCGLSELPSPPDVADAIAIALCTARRLALGVRS